VNISVAGGARRVTKDGVHALGCVRRLFRVAGSALHFGNLHGMREILNGRVAVRTAKNPVNARGVLLRMNRYVLALFRLHSFLTMARQASFILLERLDRFFLLGGYAGNARTGQQEKEQQDVGVLSHAKGSFCAVRWRFPGSQAGIWFCAGRDVFRQPISPQDPPESWDSALLWRADCGRPRSRS